ncbi:MAG: dienelactone hydrolase family protein [Deltaproteobacteria bacterium]|nr:dienelactone hydrolase family protein [Deltaproteobacteria bacterium]
MPTTPNGKRYARFVLLFFLVLNACSRGATPTDSPPDPKPPAAPSVSSLGLIRGRAAGLNYLEIIKGNVGASAQLPMVVVIHGMGDAPNADWLATLRSPARLILPQAPAPYGYGYSWFTYRVADEKPDYLALEIQQAAIQIAQAVVELKSKRPTLGKPIVCGFSQNAMLSYALALMHPKLFSSAFPISGFLPEGLWPKSKPEAGKAYPPIISMHGTEDLLVPFAPDERMIKHLRGLGYRAELVAFEGVGHTITAAMDQMLIANLEKALREVR